MKDPESAMKHEERESTTMNPTAIDLRPPASTKRRRAAPGNVCRGALGVCAALLLATVAGASGLEDGAAPSAGWAKTTPDPNQILAFEDSPFAGVVERFTNDRRALQRRFDADGAPARRERLIAFYRDWSDSLEQVDYEALGVEARLDWILLKRLIESELPELEREGRLFEEMADLLPFAETVYELHEQRRRREVASGEEAAQQLAAAVDAIEETRKALERGVAEEKKEKAAKEKEASEDEAGAQRRRRARTQTRATADDTTKADDGPVLRPSRVTVHRAAGWTERIREVAKNWYGYRAGYDPMFTWWVEDPYEEFDEALEKYVEFLRQKVLGFDPKGGEDPPIIGDPIGRDALITHLRRAFITYTPEELIEIAERDLQWGIAEMQRAAADMGFEDPQDWKQALEKVKTLHVAPGEQPQLVRDLALQSEAFLDQRDLLTIPDLAREVWRIEMMSPERQKMNPFFLGGEVIRVSFPTDTMSNEEKLMSLRGNNEHFSRATVHHELIPGHHLQGFMTSRFNSHRRAFSTPFWGEGWALYWELRLWELGFPRSPEDRIGMLFWRMHRDTRVIWSLKFHLGEMTAEECVEFLVNRIGHERENALAEVRRSLEGRYSPIYQVAYLMGGFQFRKLHREMVESGQMTEREFHDAILQGGPMPVEIVRARLGGVALPADYEAVWRYAEPRARR